MENSDCYFFIDISVPEKERAVSVLCTSCHDKYMSDTGWFYQGSVNGYGPFTYKCKMCNTIICDNSEGEDDCQEEKVETVS